MSQLNKLYIAATAMITPVGASTEMTAASVRAGISSYAFSKFNHGNDAIKMACVPDEALPSLSDDLSEFRISGRQSRMLKLAHAAIDQISPQAIENIPLFIAGPEPLPDMPLPIRSKFLEQLKIQSGQNFNLALSKVFPMGRAAGLYALESAFQYLEQTKAKYALIGGVESYADFVTLDLLASQNRIQTEGVQSNAFVPGEGAGFILLTIDDAFKENGLIYRPGITEESGYRYSDKPYRGDGLSSAFKSAIAFSDKHSIQTIYSSLNGESFGAKEFGVACTRNSGFMAENLEHCHPADCFGDLGGAISIVLIALSALDKSSPKVVCSASDYEFRGAVCVS